MRGFKAKGECEHIYANVRIQTYADERSQPYTHTCTQIHTYTIKVKVPLTLTLHGNVTRDVPICTSRVSRRLTFVFTPCMQYGRTALHIGAYNRAGEPIMRLLLDHKADANAKDEVTRVEGEGLGTRCGVGVWWWVWCSAGMV